VLGVRTDCQIDSRARSCASGPELPADETVEDGSSEKVAIVDPNPLPPHRLPVDDYATT